MGEVRPAGLMTHAARNPGAREGRKSAGLGIHLFLARFAASP
jgi:hypothetical protein